MPTSDSLENKNILPLGPYDRSRVHDLWQNLDAEVDEARMELVMAQRRLVVMQTRQAQLRLNAAIERRSRLVLLLLVEGAFPADIMQRIDRLDPD